MAIPLSQFFAKNSVDFPGAQKMEGRTPANVLLDDLLNSGQQATFCRSLYNCALMMRSH